MTLLKKTAITSLAVATFAISTLSVEAGRRERNLALGLVGGLVAGAAIAGAQHSHRYEDEVYYNDRPAYRPRPVYSNHYSWCSNRYKSYDPGSNTWVSYGGQVRNCRSPYGR